MAIDFSLTREQRELRANARAFAADVLKNALTSAEQLPTPGQRFLATKPTYQALVEAGFLRKCLPIRVGGESQSLIDTAVIAEELYSVNPSVALTLLGTILGLSPILVAGTIEQQRRFLQPFLQARGAPLAAFCLTEPGGSANAASPRPGEGIRTTAKLRNDAWIIDGRKAWVSSATGWDRKGADILCVVCRTNADAPAERGVSVIVLQNPVTGVVYERAINALGHRAHLMPVFGFDNARAPRENLLGHEGHGLALASASFIGATALVGIFSVALMRSAFEFTLNFARNERRGGVHPIIDHQAVGYALADAKTKIETARQISWLACRAVDAGAARANELATQAKIYGSETAVQVVISLMQIVGVDSYDGNRPLARLLLDALGLPHLGGGNLGVKRRVLHNLLKGADYDPLATDLELPAPV